MNKDRRKRLAAVSAQVQALPDFDEIKTELEEIRDEEQEAFDNLSEGFQQGERGQAMEQAIQAMQDAIDTLDGFSVSDIVSNLETAGE
jgi:hypothetical protein